MEEGAGATITWLIERKSWSDWCSSICDGRYHEQKQRFLNSNDGETTRMHYMIEGPIHDGSGHTRGFASNGQCGIVKTQ